MSLKKRGKIYISPNQKHIDIANVEAPKNYADGQIAYNPRDIKSSTYGLTTFASLFTFRQLTTLTILSDLVRTISNDIHQDARTAELSDTEADSYAVAVTTFLALSLDRCADFNNSLCRWASSNQKVMNLFGRQAIPMVWDFAEANFLGDSVEVLADLHGVCCCLH